ncbi:MAG: hypothetical protein HZA52_04110 [Planctomycetes bacterium]|nr:hypothetical protein [Planctomycetota bacterium]
MISVWDTSTGGALATSANNPANFCIGAGAAVPSPFASDAVRVVGTKGVLIADEVGGSRTLVDIVEASTPSCLSNWALPGTPTSIATDYGGQAHDLDITPDGKWAIVNCRNWIHVFDLSAPTQPPYSRNTGAVGTRPGWSPATFAVEVGQAVDSVVATLDRAIVVQGAEDTGSGFFPIVTIIDLSGATPTFHQIDLRQTMLDLGLSQVDPHDVAITPQLDTYDTPTLAVVTCDYAVSLFDLGAIVHVNTIATPGIWRRYRIQADSVEMTYGRAVVTGWSLSGVPTWSAKVFGLHGNPSHAPVPELVEVASFDGIATSGLVPHDLDIHRDADSALVKLAGQSTSSNLVISALASASPSATFVPSSGTPFADWTNFPGGEVSWVSDSVLTCSVRVAGQDHRYGVTIGGAMGTKISGKVDIVDMDSASLVTTLGGNGSSTYDMPTDIAFSSLKKRLFVRCEAPPDELPPATTGRDVLAANFGQFPPTLEVGNGPFIGGRGLVRRALDSMVVHRNHAISVSENDPDEEPVQTGYVHTVIVP